MEKNQEYFRQIAEKVHEKRTKKEYSPQEIDAYHEGQMAELRSLLKWMFPLNHDIYEKETFQYAELRDYVEKSISHNREKIAKARAIYLAQQKIIKRLSQVTIP